MIQSRIQCCVEMRPILLLQLLLTLWKSCGLSSAQGTCPNDLCNNGEPNVTDALVLSAYCTSEEIAVEIQRIPENVDSDRFDSFAFYYNCSIEIEESQGESTYFNLLHQKKTKKISVNATQTYSCTFTGCAKLLYPECWAALEVSTECEFSVSAESVSSYITSPLSSLLSSSMSTTTESSSNTVIASPLSSLISSSMSTTTESSFNTVNTVISSNMFPTSASDMVTSEPTTNGGGTSTYLEATTSLEQVKTKGSSSSVSVVTSVTSNQTPVQLSSPAGGANISTTLIVTLSVFTVISSSAVILLLLLVCVTLLLKNIKRKKMGSRIGGITENDREKSIVVYDGELEIGIQQADMNKLKGSMITLYQSLDNLSHFEKMNTAETVFHDTVIPTHTIQHSPSQIITTTDTVHTDHKSRNVEHNGHVVGDLPEDEYIRTVIEREDCGSYMCSIGSVSDDGYVEAIDPKYENQVTNDLLDVHSNDNTHNADHTMNSNAYKEYIEGEYNKAQLIKDWCTDECMCNECNTVTAKVNEYVVMIK